jgi:hypothetical protein
MTSTATNLPRRASLPRDVAAVLRERLRVGEWGRLLPGEFELARELVGQIEKLCTIINIL